MANHRIFVEKHPEFQVKAKNHLGELNENMQRELKTHRLINVYELIGFTPRIQKKNR